MVQTKTLFRIAIGGAFVLGSSGYYFRHKITTGMKQSPHYKLAMEQLRNHAGAINLMGEPITERMIDIGDKYNYCDHNRAQLKVPLSSPTKEATYFFWATRINEQWILTKAELEFVDNPGRRLVVVKSFEPDLPKQDSSISGLDYL